MRTSVVFFALVSSWIFAAPSLAQADNLLAVVPLDGLGVEPATLARLDSALAEQVVRLGMTTVEATTVRAAHTNKPCDGDAACLTALGKSLGATRVLAGSVGIAGDELHVTLQVVDVGSGQPHSKEDAGPLDQAERRVRSTAVWLLDPGAYNKSGAVLVNLALAGAEVVVDGVVRGSTPLFGPIEVSPGRHEMEVRYAGLKSWREFVDAPFDDTTNIELASKDGAIVATAKTGILSAGPKAPAPAAGFPVLALAGGGVAVVGVACGVGAAMAYAGAAETFKQVHDEGDRTKIGDHQAAVAAYSILMPVSLVALAAGGGLIVYSFLE